MCHCDQAIVKDTVTFYDEALYVCHLSTHEFIPMATKTGDENENLRFWCWFHERGSRKWFTSFPGLADSDSVGAI